MKHEIQVKQTELQNKQTELTENQQRPILRIEDYQLYCGADVEQVAYEQHLVNGSYQPRGLLRALVSNYGKVAADGLHAELVFKTENTLIRINSVFDHGGHIDPIAFSEDGGVIGAEERYVPLNCQFITPKEELPDEWIIKNDTPELLTPTEIMWSIQNGGNERVDVVMRVLYNDGTGRTDNKTIFNSSVELRKCTDFGSIQDCGEPLYPNVD